MSWLHCFPVWKSIAISRLKCNQRKTESNLTISVDLHGICFPRIRSPTPFQSLINLSSPPTPDKRWNTSSPLLILRGHGDNRDDVCSFQLFESLLYLALLSCSMRNAGREGWVTFYKQVRSTKREAIRSLVNQSHHFMAILWTVSEFQ